MPEIDHNVPEYNAFPSSSRELRQAAPRDSFC